MDKLIDCCTDIAKALQEIAVSAKLVGVSLDRMIDNIAVVSEASQD